MRYGAIASWATLATLGAAPAHGAPVLEPVTSNDYAIDLYEGNPLGNSAALASGGAVIANATGSSGTLVNPSAPAVRPTTDTDIWSWDFHLDYLFGSLSSDYTNSGIDYASLGIANPDTKASTITAGAALRIRDWAGAINATQRNTRLVDAAAMLPSGGTAEVLATTYHVRAAAAKWFPEIDTAFGIAAQSAIFTVKPDCSGAGCDSLFSVAGFGGEVGATWIPHLENYRLGGSLASQVDGTNITVDNCTGVVPMRECEIGRASCRERV